MKIGGYTQCSFCGRILTSCLDVCQCDGARKHFEQMTRGMRRVGDCMMPVDNPLTDDVLNREGETKEYHGMIPPKDTNPDLGELIMKAEKDNEVLKGIVKTDQEIIAQLEKEIEERTQQIEELKKPKLSDCRCGSSDLKIRYRDINDVARMVECLFCGARSGWRGSKELAIEEWHDMMTDERVSVFYHNGERRVRFCFDLVAARPGKYWLSGAVNCDREGGRDLIGLPFGLEVEVL